MQIQRIFYIEYRSLTSLVEYIQFFKNLGLCYLEVIILLYLQPVGNTPYSKGSKQRLQKVIVCTILSTRYSESGLGAVGASQLVLGDHYRHRKSLAAWQR